jgi:hypothetical protein
LPFWVQVVVALKQRGDEVERGLRILELFDLPPCNAALNCAQAPFDVFAIVIV